MWFYCKEDSSKDRQLKLKNTAYKKVGLSAKQIQTVGLTQKDSINDHGLNYLRLLDYKKLKSEVT